MTTTTDRHARSTGILSIPFVLATLGPAACERPAPTPAAPATNATTTNASEQTSRSIRLTDVTSSTGIDLVMTCGASPTREVLEVNGGGLGLIDYDRDGDLDLFVADGATMDDTEHGPGSRLFRNDGDLRFTDVTAEAGIDLTRWAMGVAVGDADGDGWDDLYVTCYGPNVLLRNLGDAGSGFEDVTEAAGVGDDRWGASCAFGDVDGDGDLDLYVVNYLEFDVDRLPPRARHKGVEVMAGPHGMTPAGDVLYRNDGDGTFTDVTEASGCRPGRSAFGLNVAILDVDLDGRQDIYVGNDSMANFLFRNVGEPGETVFEEYGMPAGVASNLDGGDQATMGIGIGDVDANGFPDLFTTNFSNDTNTLHLNLDGLFFDDRTRQYGLGLISRPYLGWACGFFDLDHDGDEDLIIFNGHVYPEATIEAMDSAYEQPPLLFAREGRRFERVVGDDANPWLAEPHLDRTAAFGDLDGDGDVDVVIGELNGPVRVLRNDAAGDRDDWLIVALRDDRPGHANPRGIGARIEVLDGAVTHTRWLFGGGGFQSAGAQAAHVGLPAGDPVTVRVTWPDGHVQTVADVPPGRRLVVRREDA